MQCVDQLFEVARNTSLPPQLHEEISQVVIDDSVQHFAVFAPMRYQLINTTPLWSFSTSSKSNLVAQLP
ncbi:hypothetical protein U1Q18_047674 [Sarracenia purpurea var. burkii]